MIIFRSFKQLTKVLVPFVQENNLTIDWNVNINNLLFDAYKLERYGIQLRIRTNEKNNFDGYSLEFDTPEREVYFRLKYL